MAGKDQKDQSESKLTSFLENVPVFDGGGRRRLVAGAIVLLTLLLVFGDIRKVLSEALTSKDAPVAILITGAGLFIYAAGVLTELVGELFLARAVANGSWAFVIAMRRARSSTGWRRIARLILAPLRGFVLFYPYFLIGIFGFCWWRLDPKRLLSDKARTTYSDLPAAVQDSIEGALGNRADFGRKYLVDEFVSTADRKWARKLLNRPRDVLAIVSAVVLSLSLLLIFTPFDEKPHWGSGIPLRQAIVDFARDGRAFFAPLQWERTEEDAIEEIHDTKQWSALVADFDALEADYTFRLNSQLASGTQAPRAGSWNRVARGIASICGKVAVALSAHQPPVHPMSFTDVTVGCDDLLKKQKDIDNELQEVADEEEAQRTNLLIRVLCIMLTLFLYLAFFATLSSATLNVIEALSHSDGRLGEES